MENATSPKTTPVDGVFVRVYCRAPDEDFPLDITDKWDELLRTRDRFRDALDALVHAARIFSTEAHYTVGEGVEEEFVSALEDAETVLKAG